MDFDAIEVAVAVEMAIAVGGSLVGANHKLLKKGRQWENRTMLFATCRGTCASWTLRLESVNLMLDMLQAPPNTVLTIDAWIARSLGRFCSFSLRRVTVWIAPR